MSLCQVPFSAADLGAKKDCVTGNVLLLHSDGVVQSFRVADSKQRSDIGADKMIFFLMVFFFLETETNFSKPGFGLPRLLDESSNRDWTVLQSFDSGSNKQGLIDYFLSFSEVYDGKEEKHYVPCV